jgi:hypothetical protein
MNRALLRKRIGVDWTPSCCLPPQQAKINLHSGLTLAVVYNSFDKLFSHLGTPPSPQGQR